jgi:tetratricopeptide (TPR) repeat protein
MALESRDHFLCASTHAFLAYIESRSDLPKAELDYTAALKHTETEPRDDANWLIIKCMLGYVIMNRGDIDGAFGHFEEVIAYGISSKNSRALSMSYTYKATLLSFIGKTEEAELFFRLAIEYSKDEYFLNTARLFYLMHRMLAGTLAEKSGELRLLESFAAERNASFCWFAEIYRAVLDFSEGRFSSGSRSLARATETSERSGAPLFIVLATTVAGTVNLSMLGPSRSLEPMAFIANLPWIIANRPFARRRAERAFLRARMLSLQSGSELLAAHSSLSLGRLYSVGRKPKKAEPYLREAAAKFAGMKAESLRSEAEALLGDRGGTSIIGSTKD